MRIFGFNGFGGPEVQAHLHVPDPVPGPGQVLIRMEAAGVNPADIKVRNGARRGQQPVRFPMAMGREAAGEVLATGPGVDAVAPGDRVFGACAAGTGALAELVLLDAAGTARVPTGVTSEQAACIPVAAGTAFDALDELALPAGAAFLVLGAGGGVGTSATRLARARGLRVIGVASEAKARLVEEAGASHVPSGPGWAARVRALAPGGVDGVLDCVGAPVIDDAAALLAPGGRLRSIGAPARAAELGGSGVTRRRTGAVFGAVAALIAAGEFSPLISSVCPLEQAELAVAQVESGHTAGKVVVVP